MGGADSATGLPCSVTVPPPCVSVSGAAPVTSAAVSLTEVGQGSESSGSCGSSTPSSVKGDNLSIVTIPASLDPALSNSGVEEIQIVTLPPSADVFELPGVIYIVQQ